MKSIKKWLVTILAVVVLGAFGVGAAMADNSSTATTPPSAPPSSEPQQAVYKLFLTNLATTLGVDEDTLTAALETASTETVNQEVTNGTITQEQADQILSNLDKDGASFFRIDIGHGPGGPGGPGGDKQPPSSTDSTTTN